MSRKDSVAVRVKNVEKAKNSNRLEVVELELPYTGQYVVPSGTVEAGDLAILFPIGNYDQFSYISEEFKPIKKRVIRGNVSHGIVDSFDEVYSRLPEVRGIFQAGDSLEDLFELLEKINKRSSLSKSEAIAQGIKEAFRLVPERLRPDTPNHIYTIRSLNEETLEHLKSSHYTGYLIGEDLISVIYNDGSPVVLYKGVEVFKHKQTNPFILEALDVIKKHGVKDIVKFNKRPVFLTSINGKFYSVPLVEEDDLEPVEIIDVPAVAYIYKGNYTTHETKAITHLANHKQILLIPEDLHLAEPILIK